MNVLKVQTVEGSVWLLGRLSSPSYFLGSGHQGKAEERWGLCISQGKCLIFGSKDLRSDNLILVRSSFSNKWFSFSYSFQNIFFPNDWRNLWNEYTLILLSAEMWNKAAIGWPDPQLNYDVDEVCSGALYCLSPDFWASFSTCCNSRFSGPSGPGQAGPPALSGKALQPQAVHQPCFRACNQSSKPNKVDF